MGASPVNLGISKVWNTHLLYLTDKYLAASSYSFTVTVNVLPPTTLFAAF